MCAESISSLLIIINFSGNFLIYCSVLKPFKAYLAQCCSKWQRRVPVNEVLEIDGANQLNMGGNGEIPGDQRTSLLASAAANIPLVDESSPPDLQRAMVAIGPMEEATNQISDEDNSSSSDDGGHRNGYISRMFLALVRRGDTEPKEDSEVIRLQYRKGAEESKRRRFMNERDSNLLPLLEAQPFPRSSGNTSPDDSSRSSKTGRLEQSRENLRPHMPVEEIADDRQGQQAMANNSDPEKADHTDESPRDSSPTQNKRVMTRESSSQTQ